MAVSVRRRFVPLNGWVYNNACQECGTCLLVPIDLGSTLDMLLSLNDPDQELKELE